MGVLSKGLRFTSLAAAMLSLGCAAGHPGADPAADLQPTLSESSQVAADEPAIESLSTDGAAESTTAPADFLAAPTSEDLLQSSESGLGLRVERGQGFSRFVVDLASEGREPVFDVTMVKNPSRLVVDVLGEPGKTNRELNIADDAFLKSVRLGAHKDKTRLVFDLKQGLDSDTVSHEVDSQEGKLLVTFHEQGTAPAIDTAAAAPTEETVEVALNSPSTEEGTAASEESASPVEPVLGETAANETSETAAPTGENIVLNSLQFEKTYEDGGNVVLSLSEPTAFEMHKTAPSEYVLTIAGATAAPITTYPTIAPKGFPGIRSARAIQQGESTTVRMFVDPGVDLSASARDNSILISTQTVVASNTDARAQFSPDARAQLEAGDQPQGKTGDGTGTADEAKARENPTGVRSSDGSKIYTGRLISLDLQDTDIDNALRIIAEVSNLNIIASDDVTGKVTLRLIDVPWDQALDVILKTNGLDQVTEGNVIRIAPIDKLRQEREALREAEKAKELLEKLSVNYIRVSYARASEMKEQVEAVLTERGTVSVDERTNQLIIKDTQKGHEQSNELLKKLDLRTPQVLLETQIVESSRSILRDLGFQWNFSYVQSPATGNATGLNFPNSVAVGGANDGSLVSFPAAISGTEGSAISAIFDSADGSRTLAARISALEQERKVKVISRPQVATVNNKEAEISSVETLRVRTPSSGTAISTGSGASSQSGASNAFEEIKVGIELKVTPQASPDYFVLLDVNAKSSTLGANEVDAVGSSRVDLQACKLEYSIVSPK